MTTGDSFVWSGPASGSWGDASNWTDSTTGTPAASPPGSANPVTINSVGLHLTQTITGSGSSAHLTLGGDTALDGSFSTGALTMGDAGFVNLYLAAGYSLADSGDATVGPDGGDVWVTGGAFTAGGTFSGGSLYSQSGSRVQVGALSNGHASVDAGSVFEVGTAGGAKAGVFTVDAGATVTTVGVMAPTVSNAGTYTGGGLIYAHEVDNTGTMSGVTFHDIDDSGISFKNSGTITLTGGWMPGSIVNNGVIVVAASTTGLESLVGDITGTGQLRIAAGGDLAAAHVAAGVTVAFTASSGQLEISSASLDGAKTFDAPISGFAAGDVIRFDGQITSEVYHSNGLLSLMNGSTVVAKLHLVGDYSAAAFHSTAFGASTLITIGGGVDTATPPAGTSTPDQYVWSGPTAGSWDAAANWTDTTTGANPAAVPPGAHDLVTINSGGPSLPQVITGTGNSAQLTVNGDTLLSGKFSTGAVSVADGDLLTLQANGSLSDSGAASGALEADGGFIKVVGTLTGGATALDGGKLQVGGLHGGVAVDAVSSVEVGTKGSAKAGTFTIDAGATAILGGVEAGAVVNHGTMTNEGGDRPVVYANMVTNSGSIYGVEFHALADNMSISNTGTITLTGDWLGGSVVNNGVIIAAPSTTGLESLVGPVTGKGQLQIAAGGELATGPVGAGITVAFTGASGSLDISSDALDSARTYDPKISGFASGDVINYGATITSVVYHQGNGILQLLHGSTVVAKLHLVGNYAGATFHTAPHGAFTSITVDAASSHALSAQAHDSFSFPESAGHQSQAHDPVSDASLGVAAGGGLEGLVPYAGQGGVFADPIVFDAHEPGHLGLAHHGPWAADFVL